MINIPNSITIIRIFLIPVFVYFLLKNRFGAALVIFVLGSITDGLDGFVARKLNQITLSGKFLDPLADKLFILSSYMTSYLVNILPLWLLIFVFMKEVIMVTGLIVLYLSAKKVEIKPTVAGKLTTFVQMVTLVLILLTGLGLGDKGLLFFAFVITSFLIFISTTGYVITGIKTYMEAR